MAGSRWLLQRKWAAMASRGAMLRPDAAALPLRLWVRVLAAAGLWGALLLPGCDDATAPAASPCVEGATLPCSCDDGAKGTQTCANGAFGTCSCTSAQDAIGDGEALDSATGTDGTAGSDSAQPSDTVAATDAAASSDANEGSDAVAGTDATTGPATCASDKDCKDAGKVCDPLTKQCVACLSDAECGPSQHCVGLVCQTYTACTNSLGCISAVGPAGEELAICDPSQSECVACLASTDCPQNNDCIQKRCVPFTPCVNSKDCLTTEVCDTAIGRCVQCLGNNDCSATQLCEAGQCRDYVACSSDKQCTPLGLLCDTTKGKCTQCLGNADCPAIYHCTPSGTAGTGVCTLDFCVQGQGACSNNAKVTCNAVGDGFGTPVACPAQSTCVAPGGKPDCKPWVCTPGVSCDGDKALECSGDGLEVLKSTDCAANAAKCVSGACQPIVCEAGQPFCDGATLKQCAASGLSATTKQTCGGSTYCGPGKTGDAGCQPIVCQPGADTCNGKVATKCKVDGSGYEPLIAVDCGTSGKVCSAGACVSLLCDPQNSLYCDGNVAKKCDATGLNPSTLQTCGAGFYCAAGACSKQVCTPGSAVCSGNKPATCNADGSGFVNVQAECAAGTTCSAGQCLAFVCGDGVCGVGEAQQCAVDCQCVGVADGALCDDDNVCTKADTCSLNSCVGALIPCDDGYPKSTDSCDPVEGCKHQWPEVCDGKDNDVNGTTDDVVCGSGACTCGPDGVATCPPDCTDCPDEGDLAILIDDDGIKKVVCAHDYPAWGVVSEAPATFTNNGDGTVSDSKTGLIWQLAIGTGTYTWANAKAHCDNLTLASKQDWRLPTLFELVSLVDFNVTSAPTIAAPFVASTPQSEFWSSSSFQGEASQQAGSVNFSNGGSGPAFVTSQFRARCVRASGLGIKTFPSNRRYEVDVSAKTVYDKTTGLTWQQEVPVAGGSYNQTKGLFNWGDAEGYCFLLVLGGKSDWRLPGVVELSSLLRRNASGSPAIDVVAFPQIPAVGNSAYWSSTPAHDDAYAGLAVGFGGLGGLGPSGASNHLRVRCVR